MPRYKIIIDDQGCNKRFDGIADFSDHNLIKIILDDGTTVFVHKSKVIFCKELP